MNYEDRPDLVEPAAIVSAAILRRLARRPEDASRLLREAFAEPAVPPPAVLTAMNGFADLEADPATGVPPAARHVALGAMQRGHAFARLLLDPAPSGSAQAEQLREAADRMYLYALLVHVVEPAQELASEVTQLLTDAFMTTAGVEDAVRYEEFANLCWSFGFGLAVVDADAAGQPDIL